MFLNSTIFPLKSRYICLLIAMFWFNSWVGNLLVAPIPFPGLENRYIGDAAMQRILASIYKASITLIFYTLSKTSWVQDFNYIASFGTMWTKLYLPLKLLTIWMVFDLSWSGYWILICKHEKTQQLMLFNSVAWTVSSLQTEKITLTIYILKCRLL